MYTGDNGTAALHTIFVFTDSFVGAVLFAVASSND